jgi:hypothetical protein
MSVPELLKTAKMGRVSGVGPAESHHMTAMKPSGVHRRHPARESGSPSGLQGVVRDVGDRGFRVAVEGDSGLPA